MYESVFYSATYCCQLSGEIAPNALQSHIASTFPPASELLDNIRQFTDTCHSLKISLFFLPSFLPSAVTFLTPVQNGIFSPREGYSLAI